MKVVDGHCSNCFHAIDDHRRVKTVRPSGYWIVVLQCTAQVRGHTCSCVVNITPPRETSPPHPDKQDDGDDQDSENDQWAPNI